MSKEDPNSGWTNESTTPSGEPLKYRRRWTLGDSSELVEGKAVEAGWVTAAWLFVPTLLALLFGAWLVSG